LERIPHQLEGNLPISLANIASLVILDITDNALSGVLPFSPSFDLIGIESNTGLLLPELLDSSKLLDSSNLTVNNDPDIVFIAGLSIAALTIIAIVASISFVLWRRKQGMESNIELRLLPKYSSPNKQVRLMRKINSGGFGVVWKARHQGKTVAIKLIRMDKYEDKAGDLSFKALKMVVDEAAVMELMVHDRIVKFIMFEIESLGIVLEYLPLGSLYDYIGKGKGVMLWTDRYQMMLDICEGMEFLHSNVYADGSTKHVLFHQDLKSANVLLCLEGTPTILRGKISDFGLSCKLSVKSYSIF
jgi:hypothetical protein